MKNTNEALLKAARNGHLEVVNALIAANCSVNFKDAYGNTALHRAAGNGHLEVVNALIAAKADVNLQDKNGNTALHRAAGNGHLEVVNALIAANCSVDFKDAYGNTALHIAARDGHLNVVNALIAAKADVNLQDKDGNTPLHLASENSHLNVVNAIIEAKADVNQKSTGGDTALYLARIDGDFEVVRVLEVTSEKQFKELLGKHNIPDMPLSYFNKLSYKYYNKLKDSLPFLGKMIAADYKANSEPLTDAKFESYIERFKMTQQIVSICRDFQLSLEVTSTNNSNQQSETNVIVIPSDIINYHILPKLGTSQKDMVDFRAMVEQKAKENQAKGK